MPFSPYHAFANGRRLEREIGRLRQAQSVTEELSLTHQRYYQALFHKLRSAKHHLDKLEDKLTTANVQDVVAQQSEFMFAVNLSIDGFFYAAGSALDILARDVLILFGCTILPDDKVYFNTAHRELSQRRPHDPILRRLQEPSWLPRFRDYRNVLTHETLLALNYSVNFRQNGTTPPTEIVFPLPDDPHAEPQDRTYENHPNVLQYAKEHMKRLLRLANTIYGDIADRCRTHGQLPL